MIVAHLMLYGNGWTQQWRIASSMDVPVQGGLNQVGARPPCASSPWSVPDLRSKPHSWSRWVPVAAAGVLDGSTGAGGGDSTGQHARQ